MTPPPVVPDARTVLTDGGTLEWRVIEGERDALRCLESRAVFRNVAPSAWEPTYGGGAVAVTLERVRAWATLLLPSEAPNAE